MEGCLKRMGYIVETHLDFPEKDEEALKEIIGDVAGIILSRQLITENVLEVAENLKVISVFGAGTDSIDSVATAERGVTVTNCPGLNSVAVAEFTIGVLINLARNYFKARAMLLDGIWQYEVGFELRSKTLGIIGLGNAGKNLAKRAKCFGMNIIGYDIFKPDERFLQKYQISFLDLNSLLKQANFVTLHVPLIPENIGLIGKEQLALMKPTAYLINTARGKLIEEEALISALDSGTLAGAALDVFVNEPEPARRLIEHPRVIATPHIAGCTGEALLAIAEAAIQNVLANIS